MYYIQVEIMDKTNRLQQHLSRGVSSSLFVPNLTSRHTIREDNQMKKIDVIKKVREVMTGESGHTVIAFGQNENGKWETYTTTSQLSSSDFPDWSWVSIQRHCTNEMTYDEASVVVENAEKFNATNI